MNPDELLLKIENEIVLRHGDHILLRDDPTWETYFEMTYLILNATLGPTSPNSTVCIGNFTELIDSA